MEIPASWSCFIKRCFPRGSPRLTLRLVSVRGSVCGSGVAGIGRRVSGRRISGRRIGSWWISSWWISSWWISSWWISSWWISSWWISSWCRSSRRSRSGCRSSCRRRICAGIAGSAKCNHRNSHVNFTIQNGRL